ncbi:hypothetical protein HY212_00775 [Candidatus Pacearchaeota archaeon]|nr:hypothetical protein [Candidatus Pacearchaeota archaeon]
MLNKDMSKVDIEKELEKMGDYVKIDYLDRLIKDKSLPMDKRKFAYIKLSEIYEKKGMFIDAAKMANNTGLMSSTFADKIKFHVREAEMYIKAGVFERVDEALKKALGEAAERDKENIYKQIKEFFKQQAEAYVKSNKRSHAVKTYEKLLQMKITEAERQEVKQKLMGLYESTGRLKEYFALKK